mgnify:CR=1 FL=1
MTDRQTETDKQTDKHRKADRHKYIHTYRQTDKSDRPKGRIFNKYYDQNE